jgi:O-antigen/teichoic acid export membrane protein
VNLGRNIAWNLSAFVWLSLLVVFVTPFMVHRMGLDVFGLWAIITASNAYLAAMDFGLGNALIRFLAAENERGDRRALESYLRSGASLQVIQGGLAAVALWILAGPMAHHWLQVPPGLVGETVISIRISSLAVFLGFAGLSYAAVPSALHRFDLLALRTILVLTVQYLLVVLVLVLGGGLREVVLVYVVGTAGVLAYLVGVSRRLLPRVNLLPGWHPESVRTLLRFGRMKFPAQISVTLIQQLDRVVLGVLLPVAQVSFYAVPARVSLRVGQVAETIASPIYPAVASHLTGGRVNDLRRQYRYGTRMVAVAAGGALAVLGGLAEPVLRVWMGPDFAQTSVWPLRILLLAYSAGAFFTLPSVAADAAVHPGIPASFMVAGSLLHAALIWFAVARWGIVGAALAVAVGFLVPFLFGIPVIHRRIGALPSLASTAGEVKGVLLAVLGTIGIIAVLLRITDPGSGVAVLLASVVGCSAAYVGLLLMFGVVRLRDFRRMMGVLVPDSGGRAR